MVPGPGLNAQRFGRTRLRGRGKALSGLARIHRMFDDFLTDVKKPRQIPRLLNIMVPGPGLNAQRFGRTRLRGRGKALSGLARIHRTFDDFLTDIKKPRQIPRLLNIMVPGPGLNAQRFGRTRLRGRGEALSGLARIHRTFDDFLTDVKKPRQIPRLLNIMVPGPGIEPGTRGFSIHCSTN